MTKQKALDKIVAGLVTQGCSASTTTGGCSYYLPDGRRCAVGQLGTVEQAQAWEALVALKEDGTDGMTNNICITKVIAPALDINGAFLLQAQRNLHDSHVDYFGEAWVYAIHLFAMQHGLTVIHPALRYIY